MSTEDLRKHINVISSSSLSNSFDKSAAEFCDEVVAKAKDLGLRVFVVATNDATKDGSSATYGEKLDDPDDAITHARNAHEEWEVEHGINPEHDRSAGSQ